jgi:streptomycin 6-kinase
VNLASPQYRNDQAFAHSRSRFILEWMLECENNHIETRTSGIVSVRWHASKALTWTMVQESWAMEESAESPIFSMFTVFKAENVLWAQLGV